MHLNTPGAPFPPPVDAPPVLTPANPLANPSSSDVLFAHTFAPVVGGGGTSSSGGSGTVTTVSVVTANGVSGSVANPTTTPAITLTLAAITPTTVSATLEDAGTNTRPAVLTLAHNSTGTPGASFGLQIRANAETSTTPDTPLGELEWDWVDAVHATRRSGGAIRAYSTTTPVSIINWVATAGAAGMIGFLNTTPVVKQSGDAGSALVAFGLMTGTPTFAGANLTGTTFPSSFVTLPSSLCATQAEQETATNATHAVTPSVQQFHPSAAKWWANFNGTGTPALRASYNVSSLTDNGVGDYTVNLTTAFSSANHAATALCGGSGIIGIVCKTTTPTTTTSLRVTTFTTSFALADAEFVMASGFGDQ